MVMSFTKIQGFNFTGTCAWFDIAWKPSIHVSSLRSYTVSIICWYVILNFIKFVLRDFDMYVVMPNIRERCTTRTHLYMYSNTCVIMCMRGALRVPFQEDMYYGKQRKHKSYSMIRTNYTKRFAICLWTLLTRYTY
jgi:hypothetical protein